MDISAFLSSPGVCCVKTMLKLTNQENKTFIPDLSVWACGAWGQPGFIFCLNYSSVVPSQVSPLLKASNSSLVK